MKIRKDVVVSILVLTFICFFVSGVLAGLNNITYPVIARGAAQRTYEARKAIIPSADYFEQLDIANLRASGLPESISEVYRAANDTGYIFTISVRGFGGNMTLLCGVDMDGRIIKAIVLSHSETISFFNRVFNERHRDLYWGRNKNEIENIDAVSGATITSNALRNIMRYALTGFEFVRGNVYE